MADLAKLTIDGKTISVPPGTLVIEAAKKLGIEIPAFCYYEGYSLAAACRMCLVEVEKAPKLLPACTLEARDGMVVRTQTPAVAEARKSMLEFVLTNHPLDCPVCDKGGECELQDMTFRYGPAESRFVEIKQHVEEKQWSPLVYFDAPRCILCYRCIRVCDEGMGVKALSTTFRGVATEILPNRVDHLECDECGMCIDVCPVGALTSGVYRYHTRPWEMKHVGAICTHCSDGCKTTLGVRDNRIIRGNNRDRSGINGEFLCIKGRFAFDFVHHEERLQTPLLRTKDGLTPVSWAQALKEAAARLSEARRQGHGIGIIGSPRLTNEEIFYLQKLARQGLGSSNLDHRQSGDLTGLVAALVGKSGALASSADLYTAKAVVVIAADLAQQHPFLSFQIRANYRHHKARIYTITPGPVREDHYAVRSLRAEPGKELNCLEELRGELAAAGDVVILFGDAIRGEAVRRLVDIGASLGVPVKYVCLLDYVNSRGAVDLGLLPGLLPGYQPATEEGLGHGMAWPEMLASPALDVLWVIQEDPLRGNQSFSKPGFLIVQDLFLSETARHADLVLPAAALYEKQGTVTSVCGEIQKTRKAVRPVGAKADLEIFGLLAAELGLNLGACSADEVFAEIRHTVSGYNVPLPLIEAGGAAQACPQPGGALAPVRPELIHSAGDTLFTSGPLGQYSKILNSVIESPGRLYAG